MTLEELADRVESATGPDRELDLAIHDVLYPPRQAAEDEDQPPPGFGRAGFLSSMDHWGANYTLSIDAATSLIPEGCIWEVAHKVNYPARAREPARANYAFVNVGVPGAVKSFGGKSLATPALALCAAALRARSSEGGESR